MFQDELSISGKILDFFDHFEEINSTYDCDFTNKYINDISIKTSGKNVKIEIKKVLIQKDGVILNVDFTVDGRKGYVNPLGCYIKDDKNRFYKLKFMAHCQDSSVLLYFIPPFSLQAEKLKVIFKLLDFRSKDSELMASKFGVFQNIPAINQMKFIRGFWKLDIETAGLKKENYDVKKPDYTIENVFIGYTISMSDICLYPKAFSLKLSGMKKVGEYLEENNFLVFMNFKNNNNIYVDVVDEEGLEVEDDGIVSKLKKVFTQQKKDQLSLFVKHKLSEGEIEKISDRLFLFLFNRERREKFDEIFFLKDSGEELAKRI